LPIKIYYYFDIRSFNWYWPISDKSLFVQATEKLYQIYFLMPEHFAVVQLFANHLLEVVFINSQVLSNSLTKSLSGFADLDKIRRNIVLTFTPLIGGCCWQVNHLF
jgi:hypothetical protein